MRQLSRLLVEVVLPRLQTVQIHQSEQIAANNRLQDSIDQMRVSLDDQFASLSAQLTACRAELAATQAVLQAVQVQKITERTGRSSLVH